MELGILRCYAGIDRYAVLFKADKWLAEYRLLKIKLIKNGSFEKDHSILLSEISKKDTRTLKTIQKKLGLVNFTKTRVQFLNEKKVLKKNVKESEISYRKKRDLISACEEYQINFQDNELSLTDLKNLIWWSIATFTYEGTGQKKIGSRLNRNRVLINRKFKENPYLEIEQKFIIIQKFPTNRNNIVNNIKSNPILKNKGLKLTSFTHLSGKKELHLLKQMPNEYRSSQKINGLITRKNKKTFFFSKRESNKKHFKNINEDQKRVHASLAVKVFNDCVFLNSPKIKRYRSSWKIRMKHFIHNEGHSTYLLKPTRNLINVMKAFSISWTPREVVSPNSP